MRAVLSHGVQVNRVSDCYGRFIFELPNNEASLLPVTSCLAVKSSDPEALKDANGKPIIRPYTPISPSDAKGELTLLVKKYDSGNASKHIHLLKVRGFSGEYVIEALISGVGYRRVTSSQSRDLYPSGPIKVVLTLILSDVSLTERFSQRVRRGCSHWWR